MSVVEGHVEILKCMSCNESLARFAFAGETDISSHGLKSAGTKGANTLVLFGPTSDEVPPIDDGNNSEAYYSAHIARVVDHNTKLEGLPFAEFQQRYRKPEIFYHCPFCSDGEATVIQHLSPKEFEAQGGKVERFGLVLKDE